MADIVSKPATDDYRNGWDRVFGKSDRLKEYEELLERKNAIAEVTGEVQALLELEHQLAEKWEQLTDEEKNLMRVAR